MGSLGAEEEVQVAEQGVVRSVFTSPRCPRQQERTWRRRYRRGSVTAELLRDVSALKRRGQWISRGEKDLTKMVILRVVFLETASCSFWPWPG